MSFKLEYVLKRSDLRHLHMFLFIRYRAIKVPPSNYFNTLRGARSVFHRSSKIGAIWAELSSEIGTTWAELSWVDFLMD